MKTEKRPNWYPAPDEMQKINLMKAALENIKDAPLSREEMVEEATLALARLHGTEPLPAWLTGETE